MELQGLDLFDIISERHHMLRKTIQKMWENHSDIYISNSEWYIMAKVYGKEPTIACVAKSVDITRQATHKFIKNLESKGLVEINNVKHNKKEKCIKLTPFGEECFEKSEEMKAEIEKTIVDQIGEEQIIRLKEILKLEWGLP